MRHTNGTTAGITANFGPFGIVIRARPHSGGPTLKIKIGIITLLITGLMILTAGLVSAQAPKSVSGTVTDATTGEPIEGALVQLDGSDPVLSENTDALGAYTIAEVLPGEQSVTASADGYASETIGVLVSETEEATANFTLQPLQEEKAGGVANGKIHGTLKGFVGTYATVVAALWCWEAVVRPSEWSEPLEECVFLF